MIKLSTVDSWASDSWVDDRTPQYTLMMVSLEAAVPMWQERLLRYGHAGLMIRARVCVEALCERGDILQYGTGSRPAKGDHRVADVFNRLAEGIAIGSFQPGGVRMFGRHWEYGPPGEGTPPGEGWEEDADQLQAQAAASRRQGA